MSKKKRGKKLDYRHDKCKFCSGVKLKNSPMCRDCFVKRRKNNSKQEKKLKPEKKFSKLHWIIQQRKDVSKVFAPKISYDEEFDILYITWFPQLDCAFSLETTNNIIFDISKDEKQVKGVEIMDFKKRFLTPLKKKIKRRIKIKRKMKNAKPRAKAKPKPKKANKKRGR